MLVVFKDNEYSGNCIFKTVFNNTAYFIYDVEEREYKIAILKDQCVKEDGLLAMIFLKYAMNTKEKQDEIYENYIALFSTTAYAYAVHVLKERFIKGEEAMKEHPDLFKSYKDKFLTNGVKS